ncbi:hypothetical protein [Methylomonas koyamae]|uniref:hypothetical protein n=1 Tax=Methylomonas koyamae TaxID=702114 RepID=UPI0006D1CF7A|nr:hypothetical protein [Methylomonas koyamae]BBL60151.1 hypothetical protein MKFW12EY_37640 [Methylomonas koyamae]
MHSTKPPNLAPAQRLRWEIGAALLLKVLLLFGLWFLIFRWQERPAGKPDIAAHFALPAAHNFSSQPIKESDHVR